MAAGISATSATAIVDPVIQASARVGTPGSGLTLTPIDGTALIDMIEAMDAARNGSTSSTVDGVTTPFGLDASTQRALAESGDRSTDASAESLSGHVDLGLSAYSELDRRIQQVADAWFAPQTDSDIVLSHFDEIARGTLHAQQDDASASMTSKTSMSYARDWQRMRAKLNGFEAEVSDANVGLGHPLGCAGARRSGGRRRFRSKPDAAFNASIERRVAAAVRGSARRVRTAVSTSDCCHRVVGQLPIDKTRPAWRKETR